VNCQGIDRQHRQACGLPAVVMFAVAAGVIIAGAPAADPGAAPARANGDLLTFATEAGDVYEWKP